MPTPEKSPILSSPPARWRRRWTLPSEALLLLVSVFFVAVSNRGFWNAAMAGREIADGEAWRFAIGTFVVLVAIHFVLLSLLALRVTLRPLVTVLLICTAAATYFMGKFGVFLDPTMLRNLLHTDVSEARDLLSWDMLPHLLAQAALPIWLLWRIDLLDRPWRKAALWRVGAVVGAIVAGAGAALAVSQDLSSLMRSQKAMRYLVTPANYLYSVVRVATSDATRAVIRQRVVGADAKQAPVWAGRTRPMLFIVVVGETARAANWGLNGYARQTTPELAQLGVVNFSDVRSCGTNTETSLPCMFSQTGRRNYDEERIRGEESLLHVLKRAGFDVSWRDNQSGCKGVCAGLPWQHATTTGDPSLCKDGECFDEALLGGLDAEVADGKGNRVVVLHQMGSHGPAYHRRYPEAFRRYTPTCDTTELRKCTVEELVNTYDNSIGYTDHVLAKTIRWLQSQTDRYDTALLYVSDHGESLGERDLFLHGMPYAIAPKEQTHVPMVVWFSERFASSRRIDLACMNRQAEQPASHDHLFHTMLGLLDVQTQAYVAELDLARGCRAPQP